MAPSNSTISSQCTNLSDDETEGDAIEYKGKFVRIINLENRHDDDIIREPNADEHDMKTVVIKAEQQSLPAVSPKDSKISKQVASSVDDNFVQESNLVKETPLLQAVSPKTTVSPVPRHSLSHKTTQDNTGSPVPSPKHSLKEVFKYNDIPEEKHRPSTQVLPPEESCISYNIRVQELSHTNKLDDALPLNDSSDKVATKISKTGMRTVNQKSTVINVKEETVKIRKATIEDKDSRSQYNIRAESVVLVPDDSSMKEKDLEDAEITVTTKETVTSIEEDAMLTSRDDSIQSGTKITDSVEIINLDQVNDDEIIRKENMNQAGDSGEDDFQELNLLL